MKKRTFSAWEIVSGMLALLMAATIILPVLWMIVNSFRSDIEFALYPPTYFPRTWVWTENYAKILRRIPIIRYAINTFIFASGATMLTVIFDSMSGYSLAKLRYKGKGILNTLIMATMMVPFQITMIPLYLEMNRFGLLDTYLGLILPHSTSAFGIFLMRSFFMSVPNDYREAAKIDGASEIRIFAQLMLPLCKPAMLTLALYIFMGNWNDMLYPMILTNSIEMRTLSVGLVIFISDKGIEYGGVMATAVMALAPMMIAYLCMQKYFISSVAMTGLKG